MTPKQIKILSLIIGIIAMILLVVGTIAHGGSLIQKILFVIGAPILGITAFANKQKMLTALQLVATIGAIIVFFPIISEIGKYLILVGASLIAIIYLIKSDYYKTDKYGLIGSIGLLFIAGGFATDATIHLVLFSILLGVGGLIVALYSWLNFVHYKTKIALIWVVLNIIFSINPILNLLKLL